MVIDQIVLVGESCHKDNRPGHDDQHPGPENRCLMGRRRWYPLLSLYIRNMYGLHQTPPCSERQTFCFEVEIAEATRRIRDGRSAACTSNLPLKLVFLS